MRAVLPIAREVFIEARRSQFFHLSLGMAVLLIFIFTGISALDESLRGRLFVESGMTALWFIHFCLAVFFSVEILYRDIEARSIYFLLVRNVSRTEYLLGKFTGLVFSLWLSIAISGVILIACSFPLNGFEPRLLAGLGFLGFEMALVVSLLVFLSTLFSKLLTLFVFIFLFFFASFLEFMVVETELLVLLKAILFVLPNFRYYSWIEMVVHARKLSPMYMVFLGGYTTFLASFYLLLAGLQFEKREL